MLQRVRLADGGEGGFTIIEVLVAAFILVLGALAVFMTFAAAIHNVQRSHETQVGVSVAQREMERIRVEPFDEVGLGPVPTSVALAELNRRIQPATRKFNLNRTGATNYKPMVPGTLGGVKENVASATGATVTVYRFVVCEEEEANGTIPASGCQRKRIVVDAQVEPADNEAGYKHSYYELQSTIVNPEGGL